MGDPEFLLRFRNEAASTGRIHHSNVVTIYESGQADDGTPYIAMEFLEGESLRQALARRGGGASKPKGRGNEQAGSAKWAAEPLAFGSAELFLSSAACILRDRSGATDLQTNSDGYPAHRFAVGSLIRKP